MVRSLPPHSVEIIIYINETLRTFDIFIIQVVNYYFYFTLVIYYFLKSVTDFVKFYESFYVSLSIELKWSFINTNCMFLVLHENH